MIIENGTCILHYSPSKKTPNVELMLNTDTLSKVFGGRCSVKEGIKMGLVTSKGSVFDAMKLPKIFSGNPANYKYIVPEIT